MISGIPEVTEEHLDCLQEIVNVAMGQAGESLACLLDVFVCLSVPRIRFVASDEITGELQQMMGGPVVRQAFFRNSGPLDIQGEALLIFGDTSFHDLAELMAYDKELTNAVEQELLLDVSNILNGACLTGIGEQLDFELGYSPPSLMRASHNNLNHNNNHNNNKILNENQLSWAQALLIEITYRLENRSFHCELMFLMTGDSIKALFKAIDRFLDEL